jgi:hypothetical protein
MPAWRNIPVMLGPKLIRPPAAAKPLQKLRASVVTSAKVGQASSGCDDINGL